MPTLRPDQAPVNTPRVVSPTSSMTPMPAKQPAANVPQSGTPQRPGLSADQPAPSVGATKPMVGNTAGPAAGPAAGNVQRPAPAPKPAKTGYEGLTPKASLELKPGRRQQIIDIIDKHAEHLPTNCALMLVEKLVEKHAELALSGVTDVIKKAALKRVLKQAFINPGTLSGAVSAGEDNRILGALIMREFVKRSSNKPEAARLFARLVKATTILNSKG